MIAGAATAEALRTAARTNLVHDGKTWRTGDEIESAVGALAGDLLDRVDAGGAVGIWAWNSAETLVAHLAVERAGLRRIPVDPGAPYQEAAAVYHAAQVATVLVDGDHDVGLAGALCLRPGLWTRQHSPLERVEVDDDAIAHTIVRGLTTQGLYEIPISFANWEAHMRLAETLFRAGVYGGEVERPCFCTAQQMMYGTGLVGTFRFIRAGLPQVILRQFDPHELLSRATEFEITSTFLVPGMITRLVEAAGAAAPQGWRVHILYGGAPFPIGELRAAVAMFGPLFSQLYGRFEGGWPITVLDAEDHRRIAAGDDSLAASCGRVVDEVEVDLRPVNETHRELRVRSQCVSPAFRDPDGWCALGDLATIDDHGYVRLLGRVDKMINTGSFHVYPDEVAAAVAQAFPEALSVRVAAAPHLRWGEAVAADVHWPPGSRLPSDAEFRQGVAERIAKYKVPTIIRHHTSEDPEP